MKNITLSLIGQNILGEILIEYFQDKTFKIDIYEDFNDFKKKKNLEKESIIVTNIVNYKLIKSLSIDEPILYLTVDKSDLYKKDISFEQHIAIPFEMKKFLKKINLLHLKNSFYKNSKITLLNYQINVNNKEVKNIKSKIKLTEREIKLILFLKNSNKPQNISSILKNVWSYSTELETHTVETHIHRLRKKFLKSFEDKNFIKHSKDGYFI